MPSTKNHAISMLLHLIPNNLAEKVDIVSIFQMEKLRLREVKGLAKVTELGKGRDA